MADRKQKSKGEQLYNFSAENYDTDSYRSNLCKQWMSYQELHPASERAPTDLHTNHTWSDIDKIRKPRPKSDLFDERSEVARSIQMDDSFLLPSTAPKGQKNDGQPKLKTMHPQYDRFHSLFDGPSKEREAKYVDNLFFDNRKTGSSKERKVKRIGRHFEPIEAMKIEKRRRSDYQLEFKHPDEIKWNAKPDNNRQTRQEAMERAAHKKRHSKQPYQSYEVDLFNARENEHRSPVIYNIRCNTLVLKLPRNGA